MRFRKILAGAVAVFLVPLATHALLHASKDHPENFRQADWSSVGMLPAADEAREARLLVFTGRTGRWKGIFAVHSWIVFKPEGALQWSRYDVVGWGNPVRTNGWAPDGRWYGDTPRVLVDVKGPAAQDLIPKVKAAIAAYRYRNNGDYRMWPGPNSNTFIAAVLRAVPTRDDTTAKRRRQGFSRDGLYAGLTDSRTGIEASAYGVVGIKLGWIEGVEFNLLGLVAGLDVRHPALKLPGFGRLGIDDGTALAAPAK